MKIADLYASLGIRPESLSKVDRYLNTAGRKVGGWAGRMNKKLGSVLGNRFTFAGAAFGIGALTKDALDFDDSLQRLAIDGRDAMGTIDQMRNSFLKVSKATGVSKESLVEGISKFVELTGDGKAAAKSMELFAKVNRATGSSMEDIAQISAAMMQNLGITVDELDGAFSTLIAGGKAGAVTYKNMAGLMASLTAKSALFADSGGVKGLSEMAAALQIAKQGFGTATEAATGLEALMGEIVQGASLLKKRGGIEVFNKDGTKRNWLEVIRELANSKLAKKKGGIESVIQRKEAQAAYFALTKELGAVEKLAAATAKADDLQKDYHRRQANAASRAAKAWNAMKVKVAEAFTPERIEAFAHAIELAAVAAAKVVDKIGDIVGFIERYVGSDSEHTAAAAADTAMPRGPKGEKLIQPLDISEDARKQNFWKGFAPIWKRGGLMQGTKELFTGSDLLFDKFDRRGMLMGSNAAFTATYNITSTDPKMAAAEILKITRDWWDGKMRETAAATGSQENQP